MHAIKPLLLALALAGATALPAAAAEAPAEGPVTGGAPDALLRFDEAGYFAVYDLTLAHGYWTAEATSAAGARVDLVLDAATGALHATGGTGAAAPLTAATVRQRLEAAGYSAIRDLEFDDGFWEADARNPAGRRVELRIHGWTGAIVEERVEGGPVAGGLSAAQILERLAAAGYRNIRNLEFDDGYWEADATNAAGVRVELRIDPVTGEVVHEERD
ncbi:PepSY domain-containing protein [Dokdonella koreensis]|uniref:Propeptide PepSY amd peptidase M4 n=1 Tax=Dokdonella koreensis DS-123 TaxID=1300342 RepID=A0A160DS83_9GAMM|nr:PepSY domain-containing protein [Dokdonella koreensis]ANB17105.1 Propeptide PepSY amd peptidase M4 [Dokdonella koreensis DS-123]